VNRSIKLLLLLMTYSTVLLAEADGSDYYRVQGVAAGDVLNIRTDASPKAQKIGAIPPQADCVKNLGCQGGLTMDEFSRLSKSERAALLKKRSCWCQVEYQGVKGWVSGHYLTEGHCGAEQ